MVDVPLTSFYDGYKVPVIGQGLMLFPTPEADDVDVTYQGLKHGFRLLDTAQAYGNEKEVAEGIAKWLKEDPEHNKREDVIYTTKIFDPDHGYEKTKKAVQLSLERAKPIGYIDIVLIHSPCSDDEKRHGSWTALQEFVASGDVKHIGVSNYGIRHLEQLYAYPDLKVKPVLDQILLHPWYAKPELTKYLKEHQIIPEAYSPLSQGEKLADEDLVRIAKKYGKSPAQILLRWSTQMGFVPIPRTSKVSRISSNLDIFDFELTQDEIDLLLSKDGHMSSRWGDQTDYPLDSEKKPGETYAASTWEMMDGLKKMFLK